MKWFFADPHFGWPAIAQSRGFQSDSEHDAEILDVVNSTVPRKDQLYILGDFCKDNPAKYRQQIQVKQVFNIWGNHDKPSWASQFSLTYHQHMMKLRTDHWVFLSHYPTAYWDKSHRGSFHLYGHTHRQREKTLDDAFPGRRSMDVGYENLKAFFGAFRPINEDEITDLMLSKPGHDLIEWYENNIDGFARYANKKES